MSASGVGDIAKKLVGQSFHMPTVTTRGSKQQAGAQLAPAEVKCRRIKAGEARTNKDQKRKKSHLTSRKHRKEHLAYMKEFNDCTKASRKYHRDSMCNCGVHGSCCLA